MVIVATIAPVAPFSPPIPVIRCTRASPGAPRPWATARRPPQHLPPVYAMVTVEWQD